MTFRTLNAEDVTVEDVSCGDLIMLDGYLVAVCSFTDTSASVWVHFQRLEGPMKGTKCSTSIDKGTRLTRYRV